MSKEILVCNECGNPLIFTFAFAYKEYYCLNCGVATEFFGSGNRVTPTPELRARQNVINKVWKATYGSFLPRSQYTKRNCKKCPEDGSHHNHLTKKEILEDKVATQILAAFKNRLKLPKPKQGSK